MCNYKIYMKNICKLCLNAQSWFTNKCSSPTCCLYLDDEIIKKFNIPENEVITNRKLLKEYKSKYKI